MFLVSFGGVVLSWGMTAPAGWRSVPAGVFAYIGALCAVDCLLYDLYKVHEGNALRVAGRALGEPLQLLRHDRERHR